MHVRIDVCWSGGVWPRITGPGELEIITFGELPSGMTGVRNHVFRTNAVCLFVLHFDVHVGSIVYRTLPWHGHQRWFEECHLQSGGFLFVAATGRHHTLHEIKVEETKERT